MYVYSQKVAGYLMMNGFVLQGMELAKSGERNVFIFNDSDDLNKRIENYKSNKSQILNCLK